MSVRLLLPLLPTPPLDMFFPQWVHWQEARSQQTWLASSPLQVTLKFSHRTLTSGFHTLLRGLLAGQQCSFLLTGKAGVDSCMFMISILDIRWLQHVVALAIVLSLYWARWFTLELCLSTWVYLLKWSVLWIGGVCDALASHKNREVENFLHVVG